MASANIGGASNDATGSNLLKRAISEQIHRAYDSLDTLRERCVTHPKDHPIWQTLYRQEKEIRMLEIKLKSLG